MTQLPKDLQVEWKVVCVFSDPRNEVWGGGTERRPTVSSFIFLCCMKYCSDRIAQMEWVSARALRAAGSHSR